MALATWTVLDIIFKKRTSVLGGFIGSIVGLATITPGAGYVRPLSSLVFGFLGAVIAYFAIKLRETKLSHRVDDTLDVFAAHGLGGVTGIFLTGLFAETAMNPGGPNGAFFGNPHLLGLQVLTIVVVAATSAILTAGILLLLKFLPGFGLAPEESKELLGMDYASHREIPYNWNSAPANHDVEKHGGQHGGVMSASEKTASEKSNNTTASVPAVETGSHARSHSREQQKDAVFREDEDRNHMEMRPPMPDQRSSAMLLSGE